jgi:hypothetical protein
MSHHLHKPLKLPCPPVRTQVHPYSRSLSRGFVSDPVLGRLQSKESDFIALTRTCGQVGIHGARIAGHCWGTVLRARFWLEQVPSHSCGLKSVAFLHRVGGESWCGGCGRVALPPLWPASLHQDTELLTIPAFALISSCHYFLVLKMRNCSFLRMLSVHISNPSRSASFWHMTLYAVQITLRVFQNKRIHTLDWNTIVQIVTEDPLWGPLFRTTDNY